MNKKNYWNTCFSSIGVFIVLFFFVFYIVSLYLKLKQDWYIWFYYLEIPIFVIWLFLFATLSPDWEIKKFFLTLFKNKINKSLVVLSWLFLITFLWDIIFLILLKLKIIVTPLIIPIFLMFRWFFLLIIFNTDNKEFSTIDINIKLNSSNKEKYYLFFETDKKFKKIKTFTYESKTTFNLYVLLLLSIITTFLNLLSSLIIDQKTLFIFLLIIFILGVLNLFIEHKNKLLSNNNYKWLKKDIKWLMKNLTFIDCTRLIEDIEIEEKEFFIHNYYSLAKSEQHNVMLLCAILFNKTTYTKENKKVIRIICSKDEHESRNYRHLGEFSNDAYLNEKEKVLNEQKAEIYKEIKLNKKIKIEEKEMIKKSLDKITFDFYCNKQ